MRTATLPNGDEARLPIHMECRVGNGRIVAIRHVMGTETMTAWAKVAVAGGLVAAAGLPD